MAMSVAEGDKVLIPQYGGSPVKVGEEEYHLFRDHEYVFSFSFPFLVFSWEKDCIRNWDFG